MHRLSNSTHCYNTNHYANIQTTCTQSFSYIPKRDNTQQVLCCILSPYCYLNDFKCLYIPLYCLLKVVYFCCCFLLYNSYVCILVEYLADKCTHKKRPVNIYMSTSPYHYYLITYSLLNNQMSRTIYRSPPLITIVYL